MTANVPTLGSTRRPRVRGAGQCQRPSGFTLIELMVAIAVMGILIAVGLPAMQSFIQKNALASATNEMIAALQGAKAEAIRRGSTVRFCTNSSARTWASTLSGTTIAQGAFMGKVTVPAVCADFKSDGLPYSCNDAACADLVTAELITDKTVEISTGAGTKKVKVRTGSIHVEQ